MHGHTLTLHLFTPWLLLSLIGCSICWRWLSGATVSTHTSWDVWGPDRPQGFKGGWRGNNAGRYVTHFWVNLIIVACSGILMKMKLKFVDPHCFFFHSCLRMAWWTNQTPGCYMSWAKEWESCFIPTSGAPQDSLSLSHTWSAAVLSQVTPAVSRRTLLNFIPMWIYTISQSFDLTLWT